MKHWAAKTIKKLTQAFARDDGTATIEFVILFPAIMTIFFSAFEISIYLTRVVLLDRALDLNVRELRLGSMEPATQDELKRRVCDDALIFPDCIASLSIELTTISTETWAFPSETVTCVDRDAEIQPATTYNAGGLNDLMLVRACAAVDPFFGTTPFVMSLPTDATGAYMIVAASTFVNEP